MQSAGTSSGSSRKALFLSWSWIATLLSLGQCFWSLILHHLTGFFPGWRGSFHSTPVTVTSSQQPCSASALAFLAGCSSSWTYCSQLQVMHGRGIYGPPWLAEIVQQWPTGPSWGKFRLSHSKKLFTLNSALQPQMFPDVQRAGNYDLSWWAQCTILAVVFHTPLVL